MFKQMRPFVSRRRLLQTSGAAVFANGAPLSALAADLMPVRTVSNQNVLLIELDKEHGFLRSAGVQESLLLVNTPSGCVRQLVAGNADVCLSSGYNGLLPDIEKGAPIKIVGAAQQTPALAVFSSRPEIKSAADLVGRKVGIGPKKALLHISIIALLMKNGIDPAKVEFVTIGSNAQVFAAVKAGQVDAGASDVSFTGVAANVHILEDGKLWQQLPEYPAQFAYATDKMIHDNREGVIRALTGYGRLYRYMSSPDSLPGYLKAATTVGEEAGGAKAAWQYIQAVHPYAGSPGISPKHIDYLQKLNVAVGLQKSILPLSAVADLTLAPEAIKRI